MLAGRLQSPRQQRDPTDSGSVSGRSPQMSSEPLVWKQNMASFTRPLVRVISPCASLKAYVSIARFDHWIKNVFVLPGVLVALTVSKHINWQLTWQHFVIGMLAVGFVTSANYVINEVMDAPFDRHHPTK